MKSADIQSDSSDILTASDVVPTETAVAASPTVPLYVDLDGTILRTDTLWECLLLFVRQFPLRIPVLLLMLYRGKSAFKAYLADRVRLDPETLPYEHDVLEYLASERADSRPVILATAADRRVAEPVAAYLDLFDDVIATDGGVNLAADRKLEAIRRHADGAEFDYVGDSEADVVVLQSARRSVLVNPRPSVLAAADSTGRLYRHFPSTTGNIFNNVVRAIRPHQWAKNVLVAVPLVTSHSMGSIQSVLESVMAFIAFSVVASGQYIANDLLDLESDRRHTRKRHRPFAAGNLSIAQGIALSGMLLTTGVVLAVFALRPEAAVWLGIYFVLSLSYSLEIKKHLVLDVLALAALFTIRVFAGGAAIGSTVSQWLLTYSLFTFTSLAFLKRYIEATGVSDENSEFHGRGYRKEDAPCIFMAGIVNGYISVLVFALYINSRLVIDNYSQPQLLWLACPLLAGWITRIWFLAHRNELHHDPVVFALTDRFSQVTVFLLLGVVYAAM